MNKRKKEALNMFFSAFLVVGYIICSYYVTNMASSVTNKTAYSAIMLGIVFLFGIILFYATRVGEGKQVIRFSPSVLCLIDLPAIYALCAFFAVGLPLHETLVNSSVIMYLAAVALGYGIPYTFTSGFEMVAAEDVYFPEHFEDKDEDEE